MSLFRPSPPASALVRLLAALALVGALIPAVDTRLAAPPAALAAGFVVTSAADPGDGLCDDTCTLRDAILNANALLGHDTITFSATVTTPIVLASALPLISQALTIDGTGQAIIVDGASLYRPLLATAPLTLTALTIQHGRGLNDGFGGGGAYFGSAGTLWGVSFISNTKLGTGGGGAYFASTAVMSGSVFISNTVTNGPGGGAYVAGSAVVAETEFLTNTTNFNGGGLYIFSNGLLTAATFISNTANSDGGGLYIFGTAVVSGSTFLRNRAAVDFNASGGGALLTGAATLLDTTFTDNSAVLDGGGVRFWGAASIRDSAFTGNTAGSGGGAYLGAGGGLTTTLFMSNTALADGGGLYLDAFGGGGSAPISGATFTGNAAGGSGGGAYLGGPAAIDQSEFGGNTAATHGGGVLASTQATVTASNFSNNAAQSGGGGGARFNAAATLLDTAFTGNTALGNGGGAYFNASTSVTHTTFALNQTIGTSARGGGAYFGAASVLSNSTFISNTAQNGHGGGLYGAVITATDTIVTGNQALCAAAQLARPASADGPPAECGDGGGGYFSAALDWLGGLFSDNQAQRNGGGSAINCGIQIECEINTSTFDSNVAGERGGGAYVSVAQAATFDLATFRENTAGEKGGAIYLDGAAVTFTNLTVADNESLDEAALFVDGSFARILNAQFARNEVTNPDGAADLSMSFHGSSLDAKHVTFAPRFTGFQLAVSVGTDIPDEHGQQDTVANLSNVIFHGYKFGVQGQAPTSTVSMTGVLWSNVTTPWQVGNFSLEAEYTGPAAFADEGSGDYHLTSASHAIDRGVPTNVTTDFDGVARPQGLKPDLGAYEFVQFGFSKIYLPYVAKGQ